MESDHARDSARYPGTAIKTHVVEIFLACPGAVKKPRTAGIYYGTQCG